AHRAGWRWSLAAAAGVTVAAVVPLALARLAPRANDADFVSHAPLSPARNRNVRLLTIWGALLVSGQYALLAFLALDLHQSAGLTLATGSLLVAVAQAAGITGRVAWGAISDRALSHGRKPLLLVLTVVGLVGTL